MHCAVHILDLSVADDLYTYSRYEGTVWDDLAHGKGVYVAEQGLVRLIYLFCLGKKLKLVNREA